MTMRIRLTGALTALALLAGCGGGAGLGAALQGGLASLTGTGGAAASAAAAPAGTAADPATLRRVELATIGIVGTAQQLTASGGRETFAGPEGFTYTLHDGMLVSTRGLSHDLMAADTRQSRAALRAGGARAARARDARRAGQNRSQRIRLHDHRKRGGDDRDRKPAERGPPLRRKLPWRGRDLRQSLLDRRLRTHRFVASVRQPECCIFAQQRPLVSFFGGGLWSSSLCDTPILAIADLTLCYQLE